jgi:hypothetical protein
MARLTKYPQKFLAHLVAQDGGVKALDCLARDADFLHDSPERNAWSKAWGLYLSEEINKLMPLERIAILNFIHDDWQRRGPFYDGVLDALLNAIKDTLLALDDTQAAVLCDELKRRRARLLAINRYPEPGRIPLVEGSLVTDETFHVYLAETDRRGAWFVRAERRVNGQKVSLHDGPFYKFHVISPRRLAVQHVVNDTGCGAKVVSIYAVAPNAEPAACEVILRSGEEPRVSPWRRGANRFEALLPHCGHEVRMGDVRFLSWRDEGDSLLFGEMPSFLRRVEGLPPFVGIYIDEVGRRQAVFKSASFPVRLRYPDHYEVLIEGKPGDLIYAKEVAGETDFVPRNMSSD